MLGTCVPHAAEEHKAGCDGGFEDSEEDTRGEEGGVVVRGGGTGASDAPGDDVEAEPLGGGELLEDHS